MSASTPPALRIPPFSWTTLEGRTVIREIIEAEVPQWQNGPRDTQVEVWSYAMARESTILVASTGWGKTAAFFVVGPEVHCVRIFI